MHRGGASLAGSSLSGSSSFSWIACTTSAPNLPTYLFVVRARVGREKGEKEGEEFPAGIRFRNDRPSLINDLRVAAPEQDLETLRDRVKQQNEALTKNLHDRAVMYQRLREAKAVIDYLKAKPGATAAPPDTGPPDTAPILIFIHIVNSQLASLQQTLEDSKELKAEPVAVPPALPIVDPVIQALAPDSPDDHVIRFCNGVAELFKSPQASKAIVDAVVATLRRPLIATTRNVCEAACRAVRAIACSTANQNLLATANAGKALVALLTTPESTLVVEIAETLTYLRPEQLDRGSADSIADLLRMAFDLKKEKQLAAVCQAIVSLCGEPPNKNVFGEANLMRGVADLMQQQLVSYSATAVKSLCATLSKLIANHPDNRNRFIASGCPKALVTLLGSPVAYASEEAAEMLFTVLVNVANEPDLVRSLVSHGMAPSLVTLLKSPIARSATYAEKLCRTISKLPIADNLLQVDIAGALAQLLQTPVVTIHAGAAKQIFCVIAEVSRDRAEGQGRLGRANVPALLAPLFSSPVIIESDIAVESLCTAIECLSNNYPSNAEAFKTENIMRVIEHLNTPAATRILPILKQGGGWLSHIFGRQ